MYNIKHRDLQAVTKTSFNLLFDGAELVVAGKLKNATSPNLNSIINADSAEGDFKGPRIDTCFDSPIDPPASTSKTRTIGHLEKLWAFLNIQQLVDKYEMNKNENSTAKAKALELALRHSFVTSLTSLVVVKPNDTTTWAPPERIRSLTNIYSLVSLVSVSKKEKATKPVKYRPTFRMQEPIPAVVNTSEVVPPSIISTTSVSDADITTPALAVDSPQRPSDGPNSALHGIDELKWLGTSVTLNGTNTVYRVLLNTNGQAYQNCTTPDQTHGKCKHLKDCVVASILTSADTYLPLFCPIETLYAGICCS